MRRFAILVAILGLCASASAARGEQFPIRQQRYQEPINSAPPASRVERVERSAPPSNLPPQADGDPYMEDGNWYDGGYDDGFGGGGGGCGGSCGGGCGGSCCSGGGFCGTDWGDGCGDYCGNCGPRFWGRAEYLYWWVRGADTPPLVTTSPDNTPPIVAGVLPGATVLFGDQKINQQGRSGGRFTLGYWFNDCGTCGIENTFLFVGNAADSFFASSNGSPILARPFTNALTGDQDAKLIALSDVIVGSVKVTSSRQIYGNEVNFRRALYLDQCRSFDIIAGYRFFQLTEGLQVQENLTSIDPGSQVPVGTTFGVFDSFNTRNLFNGGQLGFNTRVSNGCWSLDLLMKLAIGAVSQQVTINGSTVITQPERSPVNFRGGMLALDSNIGQYNRTEFGVLPELGVNLHYRFMNCWQANVGYTLIGLTNLVRPGNQIDLRVDPTQFPPGSTGTLPAFAFQNSDIWIQGINVGLERSF